MPATPYKITDGTVWLDAEWSAREEEILDSCRRFLQARGMTYLSIPSSVTSDTYRRQGISDENGPVLGQQVGHTRLRLAGSAEQGILQRFAGQEVRPSRLCARNQCFRLETRYQGLLRVREFQKVEQFAFCHPDQVDECFDELLTNALDFLDTLGITDRRVTDRTRLDPGYHQRKVDVEVRTRAYGWMETHSCSSFGVQQSRRFAITGADHTLSNTGIASPRVLVALMEADGIDVT